MEYVCTHGSYKELVETGHQVIYTKDINKNNINDHFNSIIAIFQDGIELEEVHRMMITVIFTDGIDLDLSIFDYVYNLMFWHLTVDIDEEIDSMRLFFYEDITKKNIKQYIDNVFIKRNRTTLPYINLNVFIDNAITLFRAFSQFQLYLANTLNFKDTIDLMKKYNKFRESMHLDLSNIPLEDVKNVGMKWANYQVDVIKNSEHCLRDSFRTGEATSVKQFKEVHAHIGTKPDGMNGIYPRMINHSFINGGLSSPEEVCIDSAVGRIAQILQKGNVGDSGAFARKLGLNNQDTKIHYNPKYCCDTKNLQKVTIKNESYLRMYDMRYYRETPNGVERRLDFDEDKHLIGKTLYFRSPMTCASAARGDGICYRCYGDLAYVNYDINAGQIASELVSSIYTQILLSAKHLLESKVIKMNWTAGFEDWFEVNFNTIQLYQDVEYLGVKILIPTDIENDDELDDMNYSDYITSFKIMVGDTEMDIHTTDFDGIYIHPDLMNIISTAKSNNGYYILDAHKLTDIPVLFMINFKNDELSRTMKRVMDIINNKKIVKMYNRTSILEAFIDTNLEGNILLNAVHYEVIIMNQIRAADNILDLPDWSEDDEPCQLLSLESALSNSLSITKRFQASKINSTLTNPYNRFLYRPSNIDVYYMEKPQEYLSNQSIINDDMLNKIEEDDDTKVRPIYYLTGDAENAAMKKSAEYNAKMGSHLTPWQQY